MQKSSKNYDAKVFVKSIKTFTVLIFSTLLSVRAVANVYNVTNTTDGFALNQLRGAILDADALGGTHTINVAAGTYILTLGEIIFGNTAQDITIIGAGPASTIISMTTGAGQDRIFFINPSGTTNSPVITVQGIKFENGYLSSDPYGGAAICAGGGSGESLTLTNCIFDNNILPAGAFGGAAVCMQISGNLTVDNCTFTNNVSNDADGGAIFFIMFSGDGYSGDLLVTNSTFTGNSVNLPGAGTSNGGAISFIGQGGIVGSFGVIINNNTFINNTADGFGGAISADNSADLSISQAHFNRFFNNTSAASALSSGLHFVESSGSVNAENNWWGCNTNPVSGSSTSPCNQAGGDVAGGGILDANPWLQLKVTASPGTICSSTPSTLGNTSTITASFLNNSDNTVIPVANLSTLIGLPVTWTSTLGTTGAPEQLFIQATGEATTTFTSNGTGGTATVNAQVDNVPAGETSPARASITVNTSSTAPTGATGTTTICNGSSTTLTVSGGVKGSGATTEWFTGSCGGTPAGTGDAINVSPGSTTTYYVRYTGTCNTTTCASVTVTVNQLPIVNAPTVIQPTCATPTGTITVNATGSGTLEYSIDGGANWFVTNVFSGLAPGNYNIAVRSQSAPSCVSVYSGNPVILIAATGCCVAPTITCPANQTVNNTPGLCSAVVTYSNSSTGTPAPAITYTFTGATTGSGSGNGSGLTFNVGITTVTLQATNSCGAPTCTFTVTVNDNQPPIINCPANITVDYDPGQCGAIVNYSTPVGTDNCASTTTQISGLPSGAFFPDGTTVNTFLVTDASGNTDTCSFTVTVIPCIICGQGSNVITVDQNVTVNLAPAVPTYSGDPDLLPYFSWDKTGSDPANWKAIFNLGSKKLLIKNGATITVTNVPNTSNNQKAPGIEINSTCELEIENGGHIVVNSLNQKAGDIVINVNGHIIINGEIRNEVSGTNGLPGAITITSRCGNITVGSTGQVFDLGADPGGNTITLQTCGSACLPGDIIVNGLVKAYALAHAGDLTLNRPTIKVLSSNGAVTINANTAEPLYDEFNINGTKYDIWGGLLSWVRDNVNPGKVEVQAKNDITVNGHGDDPSPPVRKSFGAIAAIATASNAPGGLVDVRSLEGNIIGNDRAFDVSGRNRLATNFAHINLMAALNISINRLGANNSFNPVVDASSPSVGDKGGKNDLRSYTGNITIGTNAIVSAAVPSGSGSVQGTNNLVSCLGVVNNGTIVPADLIPGDNSGVCSQNNPPYLFLSPCEAPPRRGGNESKGISNVVVVVPEKTTLFQAYPNPFTNMTTIRYSLADAGNVQLKVFGITGKELTTLVNGQQAQGEHSLQWNAEGLPAGVYIVQLRSGNFTGTYKLVLIK